MRLVLVPAFFLCLSGCVLSRPEPVRIYDPLPPTSSAVAAPARRDAQLRLRRIRASAHLGERIAWRASGVELGVHDDRRWAATPAELVERALSQRLFEQDGLSRTFAGGPSLEVSVLSFEEVLDPVHEAQVVLAITLTDGNERALLVESIVAKRPVAGRSGGALARAMGAALAEAVERVALRVGAALAG